MWLSYLHLTAKRHLIIFKYDEIIDILAWPLSDFRTLEIFTPKRSKTASLKQDSEHVRWHSRSHFVCLNYSLPAFVHLFSHSVKLLTALLMGYCGWLSQITCKLQRLFEFGDWLGFWMELVIGLQQRIPDMVVYGSVEFGGHWSFLMNSGHLTWSHSCAMRVCR